MSRPSPGAMVYWRFKRNTPGAWGFGYTTYMDRHDLIRMGRYNGDTTGGSVVDPSEIEWKAHS